MEKTLESTGEMKLRIEFYLRLHYFFELWHLFYLVPINKMLSVLFKAPSWYIFCFKKM